jgi:hypothetical protein
MTEGGPVTVVLTRKVPAGREQAITVSAMIAPGGTAEEDAIAEPLWKLHRQRRAARLWEANARPGPLT